MNAVATEVISGEVETPLSQRLLVIDCSHQRGYQAVVKRTLDIALSLLLILFLLPLAIAITVLIFVESGRPILFRQRRLGLGGEPFSVLKFRSMHRDAEQRLKDVLEHNEVKDGPIFKARNDPRITGVGRYLRRTSLDELPQLLNVLKGEMSLVGPRPPLEAEVLNYKAPQLQRLSVKPGMTGLWQVSGRSNLTFSQMVQLDIAYAEDWSVWKDIVLLLRTPIAVITGRGAF